MNRNNEKNSKKATQEKKINRAKKQRGGYMKPDYTKEAKKYVVKKLRQNKSLKDDIELQAAEIEEHLIGDMIEEGKEGIKFIADRLKKKKGVNSNNHFFIAAAIFLVNEKEKIAKEQKYREKKYAAKNMRTVGQIINDPKTVEELKKKGIHPEQAIPIEERELADVAKKLKEKQEKMKKENAEKSRKAHLEKIKEQQKRADKKETKQQKEQRTAAMITFSNGEATHNDMPVSWPATPGLGQWMKKQVLDPSYKEPVKVKMEYVKQMGKRTIVMKPIKASIKPKREKIKAVFISFANVQTFHGIDEKRKINIPKKPKHDEKEENELLVDDFKNNEEHWGTWELEVLRKEDDFIFAKPVKKIADRDEKLEEKIIGERFMELYNVNKREFVGEYEIYDQGKNKFIYVNSPALNEDIMPHINGARWIRNYNDGEKWKFRLKAIAFRENKRIPILEPVKRIEDN